MNADTIIEIMGGRKRVMAITGLSKGRISQWVTGNHIPAPWLAAFKAMRPDDLSSGTSKDISSDKLLAGFCAESN